MKYQKIIVENSVPSSPVPAKSVIISSSILKSLGVRKIVDFGCGRLRNLSIIEEFFNDIILVETKEQCEKIYNNPLFNRRNKVLTDAEFINSNEKYDAVFLIVVLHIIPEVLKRVKVLSIIKKKIRENGFLIVDVPTGEQYYRQKCDTSNRYLDGWLMGRGTSKTFFKQYKAKELDEFIIKHTKFRLYKKIPINKHLVRIYSNS